jgi:glucose-6-phosphate dehydrogenase assembly protein OpcA
MPTTYKVLGQVNPAATTSTNLVTVTSTASSYVVISSISVANLAATDATFRIAVRPNAETLANKHYLAYDITVGASDTTVITAGITLDSSDVVDVYASSANLAFHAYGSEIS